MTKNKYTLIAEAVLPLVGGTDNLLEIASCMTRLRLNVKDKEKVNFDAIKKIDGVSGVVFTSGQAQLILGQGVAAKTEEVFRQISGFNNAAPLSGEDLKASIKKKNETPFKLLLKKVANIFIPLIPAFIGCGLILAVNNILNKYCPGWAATDYSALLGVFGGAITFGLNIFVGVNAAKEFGGAPMLGGVLAVILTNPALANIQLLGHNLVPARGGVIAVIMVVALAAWLERKIRSKMPDMLDLFLTPFLVVFITGFAAILVLQPFGGWIADMIVKGTNIAITKGGAFSGFLLACGFLPLVMTGLHQGLAPIHAQLIAEFGYTVLFPILSMAGAGQVGAALYVLLKTKNARLKKTTISALPVGILGVGEPLIFGVTLPLGKPFLAACIGGGFGGAVIAFYHVGAYVMGGISGLPLAPLTTNAWPYLAGILVSYVGGFIAAMIIGFEDIS
ncbi:MAG: PTS transporter subunit EIIC [Elusimicrobiota bacterium]|jgi:PTS system sucrose-specific IIC component|nr:PTS transporter subunit EIIC [Elusimicrobiota bacterium]